MSLNNTMRTLRVFLGLSVREWAKRCKVSPSHVSLVEHGERQVTELYIKKVLKAMPIERLRLYQAVPPEFATLEREQLRTLAEVFQKVVDDYEQCAPEGRTHDSVPTWRRELIEEAKRALEVVS